MTMIDAWMADDHEHLEALLNRVGSDFGEVFWILNVMVGGMINAIAIHTSQSFEDTLQIVFQQLARITETDEVAALARETITAWSSGDDALVEEINFDSEIQRLGPEMVLIHFLAMLSSISRSFAKQTGNSIEDIRTGWANALGA